MKKYLIMFNLLIMMILISSCTKEVVTFEFPISRETVENVVQEKQLKWKIADEQHREFQSNFVMNKGEDEPGRTDIGITVLFESIGNKDERYLSVQMMYPNNYSVEQIRNEQVKNLPLLIDIASRIYGIDNSGKEIFNEFIKYADRDDYENKGIQWEKEEDDVHVLIRISPLTKSTIHRKCAVLIMNDVSYEKYKDGISLNN